MVNLSATKIVQKFEMADGSVLIPADGVLYTYANVAPSPCKDYCQIIVTKEQVVFRSWKVSMRRDARVTPGEVKESHEDFLHDERIQSEMNRVFGKSMVDYIRGLASGHIDYLARLPRSLLIRVLGLIDLQDIPRISLVSKQFLELTRSNDLWQKLYLDYNGEKKMKDLWSLAETIGWKQLFFKNKLQLQVQLRRHLRKQDDDEKSGEGDHLGVRVVTEAPSNDIAS